MPSRKLRVPRGSVFVALLLWSAGPLVSACGRKGPPLPPLVRLPAAPADITADRRGAAVEVRFAVPAVNTDGTRPANIKRVEVYAITGAASGSDAELIKRATRIGSVDVKAPRDPNVTIEPDEPSEDVELEGSGLDQGVRTGVEDRLALAEIASGASTAGRDNRTAPPAATSADVDNAVTAADKGVPGAATRPMTAPLTRTYFGVGVTTRGRLGPLSKRVAIPLGPAPPAPAAPTVTYTETTIVVSWAAPSPSAGDQVEGLPATLAYNVYEELPPGSAAPSGRSPSDTPLNGKPVAALQFVDKRIEWGAERCYGIRMVEARDRMTAESDLSPTTCKKLVDTFPPSPPTGLQAVASEGAISLIWDANNEPDLAGYLVLRGETAKTLTAITREPIAVPHFEDSVEPGRQYVYAVEAVDKAGNVSSPSARTEQTAR